MKNKQDKLYAINMYFSKKVGLIRVWGKGPEAGKFSRIVVLKVTLQSVRLLLTVLQKKWGAGCTSCSPNNFAGGAVAPPSPCSPGSRAYGSSKTQRSMWAQASVAMPPWKTKLTKENKITTLNLIIASGTG